MKANKGQKGSITKPLLKELMDLEKAKIKTPQHEPTVSSTPVDPAALYEDPGAGYNPDFTFPQE